MAFRKNSRDRWIAVGSASSTCSASNCSLGNWQAKARNAGSRPSSVNVWPRASMKDLSICASRPSDISLKILVNKNDANFWPASQRLNGSVSWAIRKASVPSDKSCWTFIGAENPRLREQIGGSTTLLKRSTVSLPVSSITFVVVP